MVFVFPKHPNSTKTARQSFALVFKEARNTQNELGTVNGHIGLLCRAYQSVIQRR
jgi:hypothetical protein